MDSSSTEMILFAFTTSVPIIVSDKDLASLNAYWITYNERTLVSHH